jgi:hypothetical protein
MKPFADRPAAKAYDRDIALSPDGAPAQAPAAAPVAAPAISPQATIATIQAGQQAGRSIGTTAGSASSTAELNAAALLAMSDEEFEAHLQLGKKGANARFAALGGA